MKITGLNGQNSIAVGLSIEKQLTFEGTVGDFFGALNNGPILNLKGNAGRFLGDTMSKGGIILQGNAQRGVGLAMTGGIIIVRGNVNGDIGQVAKGGTIIISGNVGPRSGAYMFNGELVIVGNAGRDTGLYLMGGVIFFGGIIGSLGKNTQINELNDSEKNKLKKYFKHYGISKDIEEFKKITPLNKNPFKDNLFDFNTFPENLNRENELLMNKLLKNEIKYKTNNELLKIYGIGTRTHESYLDHLVILPTQLKQIKDIELIETTINTKVSIKGDAEIPLVLDTPVLLTCRGPCVVGSSSKMAFIYSSGENNIAVDTGGFTLNEELKLNSKYGGSLIHQWNSNRLGVDIDHITNCKAVEIILGTGGIGSLTTIIPAGKINSELSQNLKVPMDTNIILPPKMLDMDGPADLKKHIELLRELTNYKTPIIVKLAAGEVYEDTKLALRSGADAIILEGIDSNYQNLPHFTATNLGLNSILAIPSALKAFKDTRADKRGIKLIVSGLFRSGADIFKAIALGAHAVIINSTAEIAIGCKLCGKCNDNKCPEGIATTDPKLEAKLDWVEAGQKLDNYLKTICKEFNFFMHLAGYKDINDIEKNSIRALDYRTAAVTGTKLIGYDKTLPMWEH